MSRRAFRATTSPIVYGTVRLIERDDESFLPWAREPWACIIFNLHVEHTPEGIARAAAAFRALIDMAMSRGGSYFLTYHRWARREQVEARYPQFAEFLRRKLEHDPQERFQSDWYRHYREMFADRPSRMTRAAALWTLLGVVHRPRCSGSWRSSSTRRRFCRRWSNGSRA